MMYLVSDPVYANQEELQHQLDQNGKRNSINGKRNRNQHHEDIPEEDEQSESEDAATPTARSARSFVPQNQVTSLRFARHFDARFLSLFRLCCIVLVVC